MPWILARFPWAGSSTFRGCFFIGAERGPGTQLPMETLFADMEGGLWARSAVRLPEAVKQRAAQAAVTGDVLGWLLSVTC